MKNCLRILFTSTLFTLFAYISVLGQAPNFVVILVDDQGYTGTSVQMLSSDTDTKSDYYQTPRLENMAAAGMTFSRGYAPASKCSPSRNSILTGKTTARTNFTATSSSVTSGKILLEPASITDINSSDTTIAEWLKDTGLNYRTAHYGKWHLGNGGPSSHGFDRGSGNTDNDDGNASDGLTAQSDPKKIFELTDSALALIDDAKAYNYPFYLQISHYAVHTSIEGTQYQIDEFNDLPKGSDHDDHEYAAMTYNLDSAVGIILDKLTAEGLTGTTYVIYTSDNGAANSTSTNSPLTRGKTFIYEGGIRVPLIIQGPNITANTVSDDPVIGYDFFPTIAKLSTSTNTLPHNIDGQDISGIWNGSGFTRSEPLYFHIPHYETNASKTPRSAIIDGNYKLIVEYETGTNYLFDFNSNIRENNGNDISSSNTSTVETMRKQLRDHFEKVKTHMPTLNPDDASFSGSGNDVDNDGLEDSWELLKTLSYTYGPTDNVDSDGQTYQEEHDYNSDPLTDEMLTTTDVSFRLETLRVIESSGDTSFTFALPVANSTGNPIAITYTISGTTTSGSDYVALSGTASIPNGSNKVNIPIDVIDDTDDEVDEETLILTLSAGVGYTLGKTQTFTLTIADNECTQTALDPTLKTCTINHTTDGLTELYTESTSVANDTRTITTNGVPNHIYRAPNISEQPGTYKIDLTPALAGTTTELLGTAGIVGDFGVALNGVKIEPIAAEPFDNTSTGEENWNWVLDFPSSPGDLSSDCNFAHQQDNGEYHYHGDFVEYANTLLAGLGDGTTVPTAPVQVGWAADGFPIYYKYGYTTPSDNTTAIKKYTSSYALKSGSRDGDGVSAPCGTHTGKYMQDYEYIAGSGDLDECNMIYGVTNEFPSGTSYYVMTETYPFIPRCLKGTPSADYVTGGAELLPVELMSFEASVVNESDVLLQWSTAIEINNKGFEIQRSYDWENWEVIDFVDGYGNVIGINEYEYTDRNVPEGEIYYRLKQVDFDGKEEFTDIKVVEIYRNDFELKIYPNPTKGQIYYSLENPELIQTIHIYDTFGKLLQTPSFDTNSFNINGLNAGVYILLFEMKDGIVHSEKVVKY